MRFFLDTAHVEDIRKANDLGVICGVTTNPSLIAKEGLDFNEVIKEITSIVDGPISGEVKPTTLDFEGMMKEARERADIDLDQLSAYTGIKPKNLENIENGRFDATIDIIYNIAAALGGTFAFVSDNS